MNRFDSGHSHDPDRAFAMQICSLRCYQLFLRNLVHGQYRRQASVKKKLSKYNRSSKFEWQVLAECKKSWKILNGFKTRLGRFRRYDSEASR